jgi:hypothetical protein
MPKIQQIIIHDIQLERFLDACTREELIELDMLLNHPRYQQRMNPEVSQDPKPDYMAQVMAIEPKKEKFTPVYHKTKQ